MFRKAKAQSSLEYALIIIAAVAAMLIMRTYIKRCIQGGIRTSADEISNYHFDPIFYENAETVTVDKDIITTEHHPEEAGGSMTTVTTLKDASETGIDGFWKE